eukprot:EG_transcript_10568
MAGVFEGHPLPKRHRCTCARTCERRATHWRSMASKWTWTCHWARIDPKKASQLRRAFGSGVSCTPKEPLQVVFGVLFDVFCLNIYYRGRCAQMRTSSWCAHFAL